MSGLFWILVGFWTVVTVWGFWTQFSCRNAGCSICGRRVIPAKAAVTTVQNLHKPDKNI